MGAPSIGAYQACGTGVLCGGGTKVGQGTKPILWALLSTDDVRTDAPVFTDISEDVRSFNVDRGRDSEMQDFDAGRATVTLDNRQGDYDPSFHSYIRPNNQIKLFEQFAGLNNPLFAGYVDAWDQQWPAPGQSDSVAIASCTDEFKVLALDMLPLMDPPSHDDLVEAFPAAG